MNRPKRSCSRGQPVYIYDQTKRRKTTDATRKRKNTVRVSYVDSGSGKSRVAIYVARCRKAAQTENLGIL